VPLAESNNQPFFTIGVPTYNRHDLLRETLDSILAQGFTDFEVIVGNDYTAEVLTCGMLGITDPRIRIVNHPRNLREVGNMNALIEMASGRYVTLLFDDDLYEPDFLQTGHDYLVKTGFPPVLFPSSRTMKVAEKFQPRKLHVENSVEFTGREFLRWYSPDKPQVASTFGLFDTSTLKNIVGRYEDLSPSVIGNYNDEYFLFKCALFDRIIFIDAPFYVFRRHAGSFSETDLDLENHLIAGREFIQRTGKVLRHPSLVEDFAANLMMISKIHIIRFAYKVARIEFARSKFGVGTLYRTFSRHWNEFLDTRKRYLDQVGDTGFLISFSFFRTLLYCQYLIVRLMLHSHAMGRG
jgi:glycosyltransferase involved in cell wall biosynthesis